ncbi:MAG: DEAD/DEAH box helicase [Alphaproteobacteria bacterium]|nr:DEAD/DEAH box helicase [Alphaproteobacteria bacterium]
MDFASLGLSHKILSAVKAAGYTSPTPIQSRAVPAALSGRDVLGIAQTGTGKTGAFVLPILSRLEKGRTRARMPRILIIEPTRELASQVVDALSLLNSQHKLTVALLIGGVSFEEQLNKINQGADVLIATPGRLLDHFERGTLLLTGIELLVIDEADRLLDMGFVPDIERICKLLPFGHQTLFFSATMPLEIQRLVSTFLRDPERIEITPPSSVASTVSQNAISVSDEPKVKRDVLRKLINNAEGLRNAIIFCNRKRDVAVLFRSLQCHGFNVGALHGDMDQCNRTETLEAFRSGEKTLLVASDVAARGLDIRDVSHVFNFDVPTHAEDYVHRIGRTGRAGRVGMAITLVATNEHKQLIALETLIKDKLTWLNQKNLSHVPSLSESSEVKNEIRGKSLRRPDRRRQRIASFRTRSGAVDASSESKLEKEEKTERSGASAGASSLRSVSDRSQSDNDNTPVGLGDHVPAFLMQPILIALE